MASSQSECNPYDIEADALSKVLGKNKRRSKRGVGSHMRSSKLQHTAPLLDEISLLKSRISSQAEEHAKIRGQVSEIKRDLGILTNEIKRLVQLFSQQHSFPSQMPPQTFPYFTPQGFPSVVSPSVTFNGSLSSMHVCYGEEYYIKNLSNRRFVGVGILVSKNTETPIQNCPLAEGETQIFVDEVYDGCGDELVPVDFGKGALLKYYLKCYIAWPINLLVSLRG